jgi:hypothetical protein
MAATQEQDNAALGPAGRDPDDPQPDPDDLPVGSLERELAWRDRGYDLLEGDHDRAELASWAPVDLAAVLTGDTSPLEPTQLARSDGVPLLYPSRLHDFHGPPESLKSLTAQLAVAQVLLAGGSALYLDHEGEPRDVVGHLLAYLVPAEVIVAGLTYIRPEGPLKSAELLLRACPPQLDISVIDGVDSAMALAGLNPNLSHEYRRWVELEARPLQRATAGPTVMVDHVTKDRETRGDWAAGTGAKLAAIDGASFGFELIQHFGRGRVGVARILLHKDRPGALRGQQGASKEIARLRLESHHPDNDMITVELLPPPAMVDGADAPRWMPTGYMQRVSMLLEGAAAPLTQNAIERGVPGKAAYVRQAVDDLVALGCVETVAGANRARLHRSVRPYREDDPEPTVPSASPVRPEYVPGNGDTPGVSASSASPGGGALKGPPRDTLAPPSLLDDECVPGRTHHLDAISQ